MKHVSRSFCAALLAILAIFALSVCGAAQALTPGGPKWLYRESAEGPWKELEAGKTAAFTGTSGESRMYIPERELEIYSEKATESGELIGGSPGSGTETITFEKVKVRGAPSCEVKSPGREGGTVVASHVKITLGYLKEKESEIGEAVEGTETAVVEGEELSQVFALVEVAGCAEKGKYAVTGGVVADVTSAGKAEKVITSEAKYEGGKQLLESIEIWQPAKEKYQAQIFKFKFKFSFGLSFNLLGLFKGEWEPKFTGGGSWEP